MFRFNFITNATLLLAGALFMFLLTFNHVKLQDISRTTKEREAVYGMIQQYALDGLEKYLDTEFKAEGVALLQDGGEIEVAQYVEDRMAEWDAIKSDVDNIKVSDVSVYKGSYHEKRNAVAHDTGMMIAQDESELPTYKATLEGDIKRLIVDVGDKPVFHFKINIDVIARHLGRDPNYIDPETYRD